MHFFFRFIINKIVFFKIIIYLYFLLEKNFKMIKLLMEDISLKKIILKVVIKNELLFRIKNLKKYKDFAHWMMLDLLFHHFVLIILFDILLRAFIIFLSVNY